ncbi:MULTISPECIES: DsbA family oxidoreductase [Bacillus]|uniref:DsbA family oxidoreductase n=1 Tax=Bacillus TaxID=1386 RepID=UPI000BB77DFA|nr:MULTISPECIES: DsbA family oxidoreductase [Bacillus]
MKIEVWSDYACPFCYIGKRRLEEALSNFEQKSKVEVRYKSFELDPNAPIETNQSIYEILAGKYGTTLERAKQMSEGVVEQAESVGLQFDFDSLIPTNTFNAHRLAKLAESKGKDKELVEKLLEAYFVQGKHIGKETELVELAESVGLEKREVLELLSSSTFEEEVRKDQFEAKTIGVQGVPFFVINNKYAISGAQPTEVFLNSLNKVWDEENASPKLMNLSTNNVGVCTDDSCTIEDK